MSIRLALKESLKAAEQDSLQATADSSSTENTPSKKRKHDLSLSPPASSTLVHELISQIQQMKKTLEAEQEKNKRLEAQYKDLEQRLIRMEQKNPQPLFQKKQPQNRQGAWKRPVHTSSNSTSWSWPTGSPTISTAQPTPTLIPTPPQRPDLEIVIQGIPYGKNEDLTSIVKSIAHAKQVELKEEHFSCFRAINKSKAQSVEPKPPRIIVKLRDNAMKNEMKKRPDTPMTLRDIDYKFPDTDEKQKNSYIYINENLPPKTRSLFWRVRTFKKKNNFRFAWTKDGRCFLRKFENSRVYEIESEIDLLNIPDTDYSLFPHQKPTQAPVTPENIPMKVKLTKQSGPSKETEKKTRSHLTPLPTNTTEKKSSLNKNSFVPLFDHNTDMDIGGTDSAS